MTSETQAPVRVIGAGLSGLSVAWFLTEKGRRVVIDEAGPRAGGTLDTRQVPEGIVEAAARGFFWSEAVAELFTAAGLQPVFAEERSKRRYIYRDGRPRRWPLGMVDTLSVGGHGLAALALRRTKPRDGESVERWGRRVLGRAGTTWLLAPALQGIYASPLASLSAQAIFGGARIRGRLVAAPGGMSQLAEGLASALIAKGATIRFSSAVDALDPNEPTIIATSAPEAARLVAPHAPGVSTALLKIRETNLVSVTAFYRPHPRDTRGFGILFPHGCGLAALGVLMNSDMFAGRSDLRSETWIYGDASSDHIDGVRADAAAYVAQDRFTLTGRDDRPIAVYPTTWTQRLPVYGPAVLEARAHLSELPPWIKLSGNYAGKIGVSALVAQAREIAATF